MKVKIDYLDSAERDVTVRPVHVRFFASDETVARVRKLLDHYKKEDEDFALCDLFSLLVDAETSRVTAVKKTIRARRLIERRRAKKDGAK